MKISLILFFCIFLLSCSKKIDLAIDIEQLKNDGVTVLKKINNSEKLNEEKAIISKINFKNPSNFKNWRHPNFNFQNLVPHPEFEGNFSSIKKTYKFKKEKKKHLLKKYY